MKNRKEGSRSSTKVPVVLIIVGIIVIGIGLTIVIMMLNKPKSVEHEDVVAVNNMISNKKLDEAYKKMEELYADIGYNWDESDIDSFNKSTAYFLYYKEKNEYDNSANVIYEYLSANKNNINETITPSNRSCVETQVERFKDVAESLSPDIKKKMEELIKECQGKMG